MAKKFDYYISRLRHDLGYTFSYKELEGILNRKGPFLVPLQLIVHFGMKEWENNVREIQSYLSTPEKPVDTTEMVQFWKSLTVLERMHFKDARL